MIIPPYDVSNSHVIVIHDHGKIVRWRAIGAGNNQIIQLCIIEDALTSNLVVDDDLPIKWVLEPNDRVYTVPRHRAIAAAAVVANPIPGI